MFITLQKYTNTTKQYSFDALFNNEITFKENTTKQYTIETDIPKKTPNHILFCQRQLINLTLQYPELAKMTTEDVDKEYTTVRIPKKQKGKYRTLNIPSDKLKNIQHAVVKTLQSFGTLPHNSAFAYVKGRSIYNAIEEHQLNNSKWFLKIDLKDFFGSCTKSFIYKQLKQVYPYCLLTQHKEYDKIIKDIIKIACYKNKLPQGNPISPYLTNLIMVPIDYKLNQLTPVYTRYSDDMLFSARTKIDLNKTINNIEAIFKGTPLKINPEKTRLGSINGNNWNLGLMLNKDNNITLGHEKKRKFKATIDQFLYNPDKYSISEIQKLSGLTSYYMHIEPAYISYIINKYNKKHNKNLLEILHKPYSFNF